MLRTSRVSQARASPAKAAARSPVSARRGGKRHGQKKALFVKHTTKGRADVLRAEERIAGTRVNDVAGANGWKPQGASERNIPAFIGDQRRFVGAQAQAQGGRAGRRPNCRGDVVRPLAELAGGVDAKGASPVFRRLNGDGLAIDENLAATKATPIERGVGG